MCYYNKVVWDWKARRVMSPKVMNRQVLRGKFNIAGWSSSVARRAHNPKAAGSNPASATSNLYGICHTGFFLYLCGFTGFQTAVKQRTFCVKMKGFFIDFIDGNRLITSYKPL